MTSFKNKVALVTGSARGIGKAIAIRYGSLGASVVVNYSTDRITYDIMLYMYKAIGYSL